MPLTSGECRGVFMQVITEVDLLTGSVTASVKVDAAMAAMSIALPHFGNVNDMQMRDVLQITPSMICHINEMRNIAETPTR
jgi:hypothetical protein